MWNDKAWWLVEYETGCKNGDNICDLYELEKEECHFTKMSWKTELHFGRDHTPLKIPKAPKTPKTHNKMRLKFK